VLRKWHDLRYFRYEGGDDLRDFHGRLGFARALANMTQLTHLVVRHCVVGENPWIMAEDVGVGVDRKRRDWEELGCATYYVWWRPDLVMKEPPSTPWLPSRLTRLELSDLRFAPAGVQMTERVRARLNEDSEVRRARRAREDEDDRKEKEGEVEEMRRRQREVVAAYAQLREKKKKGKGKAGGDEKLPTKMPTVRGGEQWDDVPDAVATDADGNPEQWPLDFVGRFLGVAIVCEADAARPMQHPFARLVLCSRTTLRKLQFHRIKGVPHSVVMHAMKIVGPQRTL
jgi:hypothetical protein